MTSIFPVRLSVWGFNAKSKMHPKSKNGMNVSQAWSNLCFNVQFKRRERSGLELCSVVD